MVNQCQPMVSKHFNGPGTVIDLTLCLVPFWIHMSGGIATARSIWSATGGKLIKVLFSDNKAKIYCISNPRVCHLKWLEIQKKEHVIFLNMTTYFVDAWCSNRPMSTECALPFRKEQEKGMGSYQFRPSHLKMYISQALIPVSQYAPSSPFPACYFSILRS